MHTFHHDTGLSLRSAPAIELYVYPEMPWSSDLNGWSQAFGRETLHPSQPAEEMEEGSADGDTAGSHAQQREELDAQWLARLGEESRKSEEKGRREGFELGLQRGRDEASGALREGQERLLQQGAALASSFAEERVRYFHQVEEEVVRLALAIAARILRREAQMDPLLLTGAVRVALGQLAQSTMVRMYVPEEDRPLWQEALARVPNLAHRPEVIAEAAMQLGECRIETELGSADLSLWAQLKEIERGFFDRVGARGVAAEPELDALGFAGKAAGSASGSTAKARPVYVERTPEVASGTPSPSQATATDHAVSVPSPVDETAEAIYTRREW